MGRSAVVRSGDVTVVFTEKSGPGSSPLLYETAGLKPRECGIVVAKSPTNFRADYDPFVAAAFLADCPGCATPNWSRLKFLNVNQPLWPLQEIGNPDEVEWCR
jgi:microcystin degradation protein MlrC